MGIYILLFKIFFLSLLLIGCGTDTSKPSSAVNTVVDNALDTNQSNLVATVSSVNTLSSNASLSLKITDAPTDDAAKVVITIISVELLKTDADVSVLFDFVEPKSIDLLTLQGTNTEDLLLNIEIAAGVYDEIRLKLDATGSSNFIELNDGSSYDLTIPSGSESGLKIKSKLTITENQSANFTIDFDVRKSIVKAGNSNKYLLKPVLRLVDDSISGHIQGSVDAALLIDSSCSDSDAGTYNAVYVFLGSDVIPDDIDTSSDDDIDPITTTSIKYDVDLDLYLFEAAYLEQGDYTIAMTCNVDAEDVESNNDLKFFNIQNFSIQLNDTQFL